MKSSFLIVTDRGNLKAYRVEKTAAERPPRLALLQSISLAEAHQRKSDVYTDSAGRFTASASGTGERHVELEDHRRNAKLLAEYITTLLHEHRPDAWSFAASAELNQSVLDQLEPALRKQIVENLPRDLVKLSPGDLLHHFTALRAVESVAI